MRRPLVLLIDLVLIGLATFLSLLLRDNLEFSAPRVDALLPYLAITLCTATAVLPALGIPRAILRFTGLRDYLRILAATAIIVSISVGICFAFNRMDGIARAIPILQALLVPVLLIGFRIAARMMHAMEKRPAMLKAPVTGQPLETVVVVGINAMTDLYMRTISDLAADRMRVAGLLGRDDEQRGLSLRQVPVLGTPDEILTVLNNLEVHGVNVDRIVVAVRMSDLSAAARAAILEIEDSPEFRVEFLTERLGIDNEERLYRERFAGQAAPAFILDPADLEVLAQRPYWRVKRALDFIGALALLVLLGPVIIIVSALIAIDVGLPVAFWQQRPGLGGRPFRLFKFRTMAAAHGQDGRRIPDEDRISAFGHLLRRTRLDELPQLVNILLGQMSFIGPRPLLPVDQPSEFSARLVVRPGLTGWAQVKGGRNVSPADKAALDLWYVQNASLRMDFNILLQTLKMISRGERVDLEDIKRAWRDLEIAGIYRPADNNPGAAPSPSIAGKSFRAA